MNTPKLNNNTLQAVTCLLLCAAVLAQARPPQAAAITATTDSSVADSLEDPSNAATSESAEDICQSCYENVKSAQTLIKIQLDLQDKFNELVRKKSRNKNQQISPIPSASTQTPGRPQQNNDNSDHVDGQRMNNDTYLSRRDSDSDLVIVDRLIVHRVARSVNNNHDEPRQARSPARKANSKANLDPSLKQLKHKQEQQKSDTCNSLREVKQCIEAIYRDCMGDLLYHSMEVFVKQWIDKLNCPTNNDVKPYSKLIRSLSPTQQQQQERIPFARPLLSREEIRRRIGILLSGGSSSDLKVLTPTRASPEYSQYGRRHLLTTTNSANSYVRSYSSTAGHRSAGGGIIHLPRMDGFLLIPCFLIIMIGLLTIASKYLKKPLLLKPTINPHNFQES